MYSEKKTINPLKLVDANLSPKILKKMSRVYVYFTAVNSKGEYLKNLSDRPAAPILCLANKLEYATKSLNWLIEVELRLKTDILPAVLPLADMKFYKNMDLLGQAKGLLSLQDKIQGLGSAIEDAIVMVLPGEECNLAGKLLLKSFWETALPRIDHEKPLKSGTTTACNPRHPSDLLKWTDFSERVTQFDEQGEAWIHDRRSLFYTSENLIRSEAEVFVLLVKVLEIVCGSLRDTGKLIKIQQQSGSRPRTLEVGKSEQASSEVTETVTKTGNPDIVMCAGGDRERVLAVAECKSPWTFPFGNSARYWTQNWKSNQLNVRKIISQLYGYMHLNDVRFGILSSYSAPYFLKREVKEQDKEYLFISDPVLAHSHSPTLYKSLFHFFHLALEDCQRKDVVSSGDEYRPPGGGTSGGSSAEASGGHIRRSDRLSRKSRRPISQPYDVTSKRGRRDQSDNTQHHAPGSIPCDVPKNLLEVPTRLTPEDLRRSIYLDEGASGAVCLLRNYRKCVVKMVDIYKNGPGYDQLLHEIDVYKKLEPFHLDFIPKFYFDQELYVVHCLVLEYIEGKPCHWEDDPALTAKVKSCVHRLKSLGVKHMDLRPENVLLTPLGDIKIIDFGLCKINDEVLSQASKV